LDFKHIILLFLFLIICRDYIGSKSNQIFCKDILQILYKDDPLRFLI